MEILGINLKNLLSEDMMLQLLPVALIVLLGIPLILIVSRWIRTVVSKRFSSQRGMVVAKIVRYTGIVFITVLILNQLGFQLGALLGAAGIIGIAVGFASQTSVSNIISGIFLIAEQPFVVDDVIKVGDTTGVVLSIDVLSIKLRTFDNQFVRIPNETILKSQVTTKTRFPIRRVELNIPVAYREDLSRVKTVLLDVVARNPLCLQEPEPVVFYDRFNNFAVDLRLTAWAAREEWLKVKTQLFEEVKARLDREGIEIPFPHVSVYAGSRSGPLPIRLHPTDNGDMVRPES